MRPHAGGNPVPVYGATTDTVLLHFVRGASPNGDCVPGHANYEVRSSDDGATWSAPRDISHFHLRFLWAFL